METNDVEFDDEYDEKDEEMDDQNDLEDDLDDESSEDESSDEDDKLEIELKNVNDAISLNPNDYDSYVKLIELCKIAGDSRPDELRDARERMSKIFPLTIELWLSWLRDEKERIKNNQELNKEDNQRIINLFERAIQDYVSVDIWVEYQSFVLSMIIQGENVDIIDVHERALMNVGLHPIQGHRVWEIYRGYLLAIDKETDLKSVFILFQRQLSIPSISLEATFNEFQKLISETGKQPPFDLNSLELTYKRSREQFEKLRPFEDKLKVSPSLENYIEYLDYEINQKSKDKNPSRIQFLFERAIADQTHCLSSQLWIKYLQYLKELNSEKILIDVLKRAIRNVPSCSEIWIEYIRTIERFERSEQEALNVFEKSLESVFYNEEDYRKIWLCYLEYRRRKTDFNNSKQVELLRKNFETCINHLTQMNNADPNFDVSIYQAYVEAKFCSNITKSREIWNEIMKSHQSMGILQKDYWLEYAKLEKLFGCKYDFRTYKEVMLKALEHCPESFDLLSYQLIRDFKFESNDIKEIDAIEKSVSNIFERVVKIYRAKKEESKGVKRKENPVSNKSDLKDNKKFKKELVPEPSKSIAKPAVEFKKPISDENDLNTVVVKNLSYELDENALKEEFKKFGTIKEIRLPRKFNGKSKGYCFIEFTSEAEARNAIANDNMLIGGRKTFISAKNEKTKFKYETGLEKNKLFVSKLPPKLTQQELTQFFSKFEGFKEARLNTDYKTGKSKGNAYIEFKSDLDASKALDKTKDTKVGEISRKFSVDLQFKKISVALSNPPQKKNEDQNDKMLGDGMFKKPNSFGRAKPKLQL